MTFEELGALLRSEREKRRLSIERVADELKINARVLSALEAGDPARLPPPAYTRGFIRTYAGFLGFDNEEIHGMLDAVQGKSAARSERARSAPEITDAQLETSTPDRKKGGGFWIIIFILAIAAGGAYWAWSQGYMSFLAANKTEKIASIEQLPSADAWKPPVMPTQPAPREQERNDAAPLQTSEVSQPKLSETAAPAQAADNAEKEKDDQTASESQTDANEKKPAPAIADSAQKEETPQHHKLIITATEECWVHSRADKTDTRQFSLRKGDTFALTFAKDLELKLGNAGGVSLRYDGRELPVPGTSGQVKTLVFPPKDNR